MDVLWSRGRASVADVVSYIEGRKPAYTTALTMLRSLEEKGYARHDMVGRAFFYSARIEKHDARSSILEHLKRSFFDGSAAVLMAHLVKDERLTLKQIRDIRALLDAGGERS